MNTPRLTFHPRRRPVRDCRCRWCQCRSASSLDRCRCRSSRETSRRRRRRRRNVLRRSRRHRRVSRFASAQRGSAAGAPAWAGAGSGAQARAAPPATPDDQAPAVTMAAAGGTATPIALLHRERLTLTCERDQPPAYYRGATNGSMRVYDTIGIGQTLSPYTAVDYANVACQIVPRAPPLSRRARCVPLPSRFPSDLQGRSPQDEEA